MSSDDFIRIKELLSSPKKIAIVTHRNPDGDAYGSSLALYFYLKKLEHEVSMVSPNDCPEFLKWMPGVEDILIYEDDPDVALPVLQSAEIIFALDFNALHRLGNDMSSGMQDLDPIYIMIDHHQEPDDFAEFSYVDPQICSTSQMIYQFMIG